MRERGREEGEGDGAIVEKTVAVPLPPETARTPLRPRYLYILRNKDDVPNDAKDPQASTVQPTTQPQNSPTAHSPVCSNKEKKERPTASTEVKEGIDAVFIAGSFIFFFFFFPFFHPLHYHQYSLLLYNTEVSTHPTSSSLFPTSLSELFPYFLNLFTHKFQESAGVGTLDDVDILNPFLLRYNY